MELLSTINAGQIAGLCITLAALFIAVREIKRSVGKWVLRLIEETKKEVKAQTEPLKHELTTNGGSSAKDQIGRIERGVTGLTSDVNQLGEKMIRLDERVQFIERRQKRRFWRD